MQKNPKPLIVMDTNVIISSAINPSGAPAASLQYALGKYQPAFTEQTYGELVETLRSVHLKSLISDQRQIEIKDALKKEGKFFEQKLELDICRDPKDNKFISLAEQEKAKYLVTGDKDLLAIDRNKLVSTEIITPKQFAEQEKQLSRSEAHGLSKEKTAEFETLRQQKIEQLLKAQQQDKNRDFER